MKKLLITVEGKTYEVEVELLDEVRPTAPKKITTRRPAPAAAQAAAVSSVSPPPAENPSAATASSNGVKSPLAAVVVSVDVKVGDTVAEGQTVATLEAMKMNTIVTATSAGTIKSIDVTPGDAVEEGQPLVSFA